MAGFDIGHFERTAQHIRAKAIQEGRLLHNPPDDQLERLAEQEPEVTRTVYGNLVAESEPTSRAAAFTENSVDHPFGDSEMQLLRQCEEALAKGSLISVDRTVGDAGSGTVVRLTVPVDFAHVAYGGKNLFAPVLGPVEQPDYEIIMFKDGAFESNKSRRLPKKDVTIRLAMLPQGRVVKVVRNSNYIGEYKKGVFASEDWVAKRKRGGIFLHAGCRADYLQSVHGGYRGTRSLLIGLSANGKTTTTCKVLARKGNEKSWLVQDDGGTLMPDGSFHGFELGGVYVKTEAITPGEQTEIYYGVLKPGTLGENIFVTAEGDFDFHHLERTSNARAVVQRRDLMHASQSIDAESIDNLILITRGPLVPAIAKLDLEEAVAFMVLGQAMESSAGDPTRAGKIRTEFFYDPFVAGDRAEHANTLYEILRGLPHVNYYLINTGAVGEGMVRREIKLEHTLAILESLLRGGLEDWVDSGSGFKVPAAVRMVDDIYFHPEMLYSRLEFEQKRKRGSKARRETIEAIGPGLHRAIREVFR